MHTNFTYDDQLEFSFKIPLNSLRFRDMALLLSLRSYENNESNHSYASHCLRILKWRATQRQYYRGKTNKVGHVSPARENPYQFNVNYPYYALPNRTMHIKPITFYRLRNQIRHTQPQPYTQAYTPTGTIVLEVARLHTHGRPTGDAETKKRMLPPSPLSKHETIRGAHTTHQTL